MSGAAERLRYLAGLQDRLGGSIPYERWMQDWLYHDTFGYYTNGIRAIGRAGDFTTWPTRHAGLGRAIARWAKANKPDGPWHLIEVGAGAGDLAVTILDSCPWWSRPRYHIVEISPALQARQEERLGGRHAVGHTDIREALAACEWRAVIISNELVDAFPCRVFRRDDDWQELSLAVGDRGITEVWTDCDAPESTVAKCEWPRGQRVEVHDSFRDWLDGWFLKWKAGAMLTIDYGDTCPELYHRRPAGTLRAYAHHQRLEGTEAHAGFGMRDLTADVNFSDLRDWMGGGTLTTLGEFLAAQNAGRIPADLAEGAASAFKALETIRR